VDEHREFVALPEQLRQRGARAAEPDGLGRGYTLLHERTSAGGTK
jgi:hypothetical protein